MMKWLIQFIVNQIEDTYPEIEVTLTFDYF
jgi:hypothetical protein